MPPGFPIWGWVMVSLALGQCAGMVTMFYLHWGARKIYCPRCLYYLNWRHAIHSATIPEQPPAPRAGEHGAISLQQSSPDPW